MPNGLNLSHKDFVKLFSNKEIKANSEFLKFRENIGYDKKFEFKNLFLLFISLIHSIYQPILNIKIRNKKLKYYLKMHRFLAYK